MAIGGALGAVHDDAGGAGDLRIAAAHHPLELLPVELLADLTRCEAVGRVEVARSKCLELLEHRRARVDDAAVGLARGRPRREQERQHERAAHGANHVADHCTSRRRARWTSPTLPGLVI